MRLPLLVSCAFLCLLATTSFGQDSNTTFNKVVDFPTKFLDNVNKKASKLEDKLMAYTEKALKKLERQEQKLKKKLAKKDSLAAMQVFGDVEGKYKELREKLSKGTDLASKANLNNYIPYFDTLKTSLKF
ncbi:MAG TPA: hypothetical protein VIY47_05555, partial [Ignavibacteriaceae bacterium]